MQKTNFIYISGGLVKKGDPMNEGLNDSFTIGYSANQRSVFLKGSFLVLYKEVC